VLVQIEKSLGVSFEQVLALLRGEIAFYARPGAVIPDSRSPSRKRTRAARSRPSTRSQRDWRRLQARASSPVRRAVIR
jgi:hypothetical protein